MSTRNNYSAFTDSRNAFHQFEKTLGVVFTGHVRAKHLFHQHLIGERKEFVFRHDGVAGYIASFNKANEMLGQILLLTGGQPGRIAELVELKYENTVGRLRGIVFIIAGQAMYILLYSKGTSQTGKDQHIGHAIPWCVTDMIIILKGLVVPFVGVMAEELYGKKVRAVLEHSVLTEDGATYKANHFGDRLQAWFLNNLEVPIRPQLHHQMTVSICKWLMPRSTGKIGRGLNVFDTQASHSSEVTQQHYGLEVDDPHRYGDTFFEGFSMILHWWWLLIWHENMDLLMEDEVDRGRAAPQRLGLGRKPVLGNPSEFARQLGRQVASKLQACKVGLQRLSGIDAKRGAGVRLPKEPSVKSMKATQVLIQAHHNMTLQMYCGDPNTTWTCDEQVQALVHVLERRTSLLIILPTGAGKLVLFGAPQYFEQGVTIVMSPLRALMLNQIEESKTRDPRTPFVPWHNDLDVQHGVVITPAENLRKSKFKNWCATQQAQGHLVRIVIDEAHLVPSSKDYQFIMRCLKPLVEAQVPIVCLTAMLPPSMEDELRGCIGDPRWQIIWTGTQHRNLHLQVACYEKEEHAKGALKRILERYTSELAAYQSIMIVVPWRQVADELATELKVDAYHSGLTTEQKDRAAACWLSGETQIIVGMTAIGTGVHHPHCSLVIHWGFPHGLLSYAQETGRAGQTGSPGLCILFHWGAYPTLRGEDNKGFCLMVDMLKDSKCMRVHLSRYLDGADLQTSCFSNTAHCTRCLLLRQRAESHVGHHPTNPVPHYEGGCLPEGALPYGLLMLGALGNATGHAFQDDRPQPNASPSDLDRDHLVVIDAEPALRSAISLNWGSSIDEEMVDWSGSSEGPGNNVGRQSNHSTDHKVDPELDDEMDVE
ncbi:hypothetical protein FRC06_006581 [Ceratobasidium sp. 370]|nr:hypothetical protein FRC06_006581 [Ceratobasidium sp. 370]